MNELVIDVDGLTKRFGDFTAVSDFSIQVPAGKIFGFLGPNGSGKTTSIRMLCGLLKPDGGSGECLGFDVRTETEAIKALVGYMTQHFSLYEELTVAENLTFAARLFQLSARNTRVEEVVDMMGLGGRTDQLAGTLSGGWKQRLALAVAILHHPRLLLLDEPTAGVDPQARREFWDHIRNLADAGLTVLVSTHYMDEAERCDSLVYLLHGKVLAKGAVDVILEQSGLITWTVAGHGLGQLAERLRREDAIDQVAAFGERLHITGTDEQGLDRAIDRYRGESGLTWRKSAPDLEDVFIHLMASREDRNGG